MNILNLHMDTRKRCTLFIESFTHDTWNRLGEVPADEVEERVAQIKQASARPLMVMSGAEMTVR